MVDLSTMMNTSMTKRLLKLELVLRRADYSTSGRTLLREVRAGLNSGRMSGLRADEIAEEVRAMGLEDGREVVL